MMKQLKNNVNYINKNIYIYNKSKRKKEILFLMELKLMNVTKLFLLWNNL